MNTAHFYNFAAAQLLTSLLAFHSTVYAADTKNKDGVTTEEKRLQREEDGIKNKKQCMFAKNQMTAALVGEDWVHLERISRDYSKECKGIFGPEDVSSAHENIAIANNELGNSKQALAAADMCINIHYANPGCHIQKAEALISLKKNSDALKALDASKKLVRHALADARRERERALADIDKELQDSLINLYENQLYRIDRMRERTY